MERYANISFWSHLNSILGCLLLYATLLDLADMLCKIKVGWTSDPKFGELKHGKGETLNPMEKNKNMGRAKTVWGFD